MDDLLTTDEAARLLGKAPRTVRGYIERGLLPVARRVNPRLVLVRRADVERLGAAPPRSGPRRVPDTTTERD
jgi:excisionase family DNA binding protein